MGAKTMMTRFVIEKPKSDELYIYTIPECNMVRLHKGDIIRLRKYKRGYPFNDLEVWEAVVVHEPTFHINWSDPVDTGADAYDIDSVIPIQWVTVEIKSHRWV